MLSLLRSSIAVTEFSFSSAGARSASLSATSPLSCWDSAEVLANSVTIAPPVPGPEQPVAR